MGAISSVPVESVKNEITAPTYVDNRVLAANTAESFTKPSGVQWLWIGSTDTVYMRFDGSAAVVPGADVADGTGSMPLLAGNGLLFNVRGITSGSVISAGTSVVGLAWYADAGGR